MSIQAGSYPIYAPTQLANAFLEILEFLKVSMWKQPSCRVRAELLLINIHTMELQTGNYIGHKHYKLFPILLCVSDELL